VYCNNESNVDLQQDALMQNIEQVLSKESINYAANNNNQEILKLMQSIFQDDPYLHQTRVALTHEL
jgi:hypothetical protein